MSVVAAYHIFVCVLFLAQGCMWTGYSQGIGYSQGGMWTGYSQGIGYSQGGMWTGYSQGIGYSQGGMWTGYSQSSYPSCTRNNAHTNI
jgi:hypothetical protein